MPDSPDVAYLKPFIESTIDAAARFRRVLIVMVTASILAFGAAWNSTSTGWFNSRLLLTRKAERYLALKEKGFRLGQIEKTLGGDGQLAEPEKKKLEVEKEKIWREANDLLGIEVPGHKPLTELKDLDPELNRLYSGKLKDWIRLRGFYDAAQATQYAQKLDEARTANLILVRIPLSGTVFDVNDLGLLGGITFTAILLMFRFTLWREYNNLWLTFREARDEHLEYCFRSLAMQQVLTVPPSLSRKPRQRPWGKIVRFLYFAPLIVQLLILVNDINTKPIGSMLDSLSTTISIIGSSVGLIVIVYLTFRCLLLSVSIDKEWEEWSVKARRKTSQAWSG